MNNYVVITTIVDPIRTIELACKYLCDSSLDKLFIYDNGHTLEDAEKLKSINILNSKAEYVDTRG